MHVPVVWAIGAEVTHQMLVTEFDAFEWRFGRFMDLWPLLGDGMLNIDGAYHREMRRLLLPAFHREQVQAVADAMVDEARRGGGGARAGHDARRLPLGARAGPADRPARAARDGRGRPPRARRWRGAFERALRFHGEPVWRQVLRGPGTPYARTLQARRELDRLVHDEIDERRRRGEHGAGVLGLLLGATDADGRPLGARAVRDQTVTLLFAGHDTTTATLFFLLYELARAPRARAALEAELDAARRARGPPGRPAARRHRPARPRAHARRDAAPLPARLGRPAPRHPRRRARRRADPGRRARALLVVGDAPPRGAVPGPVRLRAGPLPGPSGRRPRCRRGAYVPFGGGSRMCLGKRFGQTELRALAAVHPHPRPRWTRSRAPPCASPPPRRWGRASRSRSGWRRAEHAPRPPEAARRRSAASRLLDEARLLEVVRRDRLAASACRSSRAS